MAGINWNILDQDGPIKAGMSFQGGMDNALARRQAEQQTALQSMQMQQAQQAIAEKNALRDLYRQSGGDPRQVVQALKQSGNIEQAMGLESKMQEQQKGKIEHAISLTKFMREGSTQIYANPDPSFAVAKLQEFSQLAGQDMSGEIQKVSQMSPQQIQQWARGHIMTAEQMLPKLMTINQGGQTSVVPMDPMSAQPVGAGTAFQNTMTPGQAESHAIQLRGQNLTDERGREANKLKEKEIDAINRGIVDKTTRETELKLQDDYRAESKGFAEVATSMKKVLGSLDSATTNAGSALAAGTAFMKILDPNSVVRETELGMALNASGWFDRATNIVNTIKSGKVMTPTQVENLKSASKILFEEAKAAQKEIDAAYEKRTMAYGGNPQRVIVDRGQGVSSQTTVGQIKFLGFE